MITIKAIHITWFFFFQAMIILFFGILLGSLKITLLMLPFLLTSIVLCIAYERRMDEIIW